MFRKCFINNILICAVINIESDMSALELLKFYCNSESSTTDEEDFVGFDLVDGTGEQFVPKSHCFQLENYVPPSVPPRLDVPDNSEPIQSSSAEEENSVDSDGSFFETSTTTRVKTRKRTLKETKKRISAKKRRRSHQIKLTKCCTCRQECWKTISKDERISVHTRFWKQDAAGQSAFIRERVQRIPVKNRKKNHYVLDNPVKLYTYVFNIQSESGKFVVVCRKFFLNTLGYSEDCG